MKFLGRQAYCVWDLTTALSGSGSGCTVRVWNPATGIVQKTREGYFGLVEGVAFSPDVKLIASGSRHGTVRLWDLGTSARRQTLEAHSNWFNAVAFSAECKLLASGSGCTVRFWGPAATLIIPYLFSFFMFYVHMQPCGL